MRLLAAGEMLAAVPRRFWLAVSYLHRLRCRARLRARVSEMLKSAPRPMRSFDVGYDEHTMTTADGTVVWSDSELCAELAIDWSGPGLPLLPGVLGFHFRSECGSISYVHPGASPPVIRSIVASGHAADGSAAAPLWPPSGSPFVLAPESRGGWCYYNVDTGAAQWIAPEGSTPIDHRPLPSAHPRTAPPPLLHPSISLGCAPRHWDVIYEDVSERVLLHCTLTGATRAAPWLALRDLDGNVYYANLITHQTRWFPPAGWMSGWISREEEPRFDPRSPRMRDRLPRAEADRMVEGGAPYLCPDREHPQYLRVATDTHLTYQSMAAIEIDSLLAEIRSFFNRHPQSRQFTCMNPDGYRPDMMEVDLQRIKSSGGLSLDAWRRLTSSVRAYSRVLGVCYGSYDARIQQEMDRFQKLIRCALPPSELHILNACLHSYP